MAVALKHLSSHDNHYPHAKIRPAFGSPTTTASADRSDRKKIARECSGRKRLPRNRLRDAADSIRYHR
ncbi:hypothetical protein, partial [Burkholderia sp. SIMBA_051]|uniref:hypothetical protein n=1 Tax=Burkholderia sp. SIMBA_051 TaxID=3085792 RepID=UPI00397A1192